MYHFKCLFSLTGKTRPSTNRIRDLVVLITHWGVAHMKIAGLQGKNHCSLYSVMLTTTVTYTLASLSKVSLFPWFSEIEKNLLTSVSKVIYKK